jgi:hypothetical protein
MGRNSDSAIQRLQVGLIGLLAVLVFVSIASMLSGRAGSDGKAAVDASKPVEKSNEPLVETGVTPVVPEQPEKQAKRTAPATTAPQR